MGEPREPQNVALGRAIRQLRKEARLTQEELAERAQVPVERLRQIEAGAVDARWGTLRHVAYALETDLASVFRLAEFDHAEEQQQDQGDHGRDDQ
ncbi:MAG TPA: helix-turn-helix transcriptional regulator [Solirubrobacterales bacterium]|nr:helix-turn-helix transcriptional regulator [Solirubrobacterales bacterium]